VTAGQRTLAHHRVGEPFAYPRDALPDYASLDMLVDQCLACMTGKTVVELLAQVGRDAVVAQRQSADQATQREHHDALSRASVALSRHRRTEARHQAPTETAPASSSCSPWAVSVTATALFEPMASS
jgi:hypothetical protein